MSLAVKLRQKMKEKDYSLTHVSKAINVSIPRLGLWLNNKYTGNVTKVNEAVKSFLEREELRERRIKFGFINTSVAVDVFDIAKTCSIENIIGVCCGPAGLGKTVAVRQYAKEHTEVILIEADFGYTPKVLFSEIHKQLGFDGCGTIHSMLLDIVEKLKASDRLIIVDEAENLPYKALELLRRIYDKANVGILLVGMPRLFNNLKGEKGQYAQLYSRVGITSLLDTLSEDDMKAIISTVTPLVDSIYPKISKYCGGNTRVLTKLLVRAHRIAELNDIEINEDVIQASIRQLIF